MKINVKEVKVYLDSNTLKMIEELEKRLRLNRSEIVRSAVRLMYVFYQLGE